MGKVILCTGKTARNPYYFLSTGTRVYTIEELCYYIYHNIETVSEELVCPELVAFLRNELGLEERANQLEKLYATHAGIKDIIVLILCSADYYEEEEIRLLLNELDSLNEMTPLQRKKRNADHYLENGQYRDAMKAYRNILYSREPVEMNSIEYGNILHNLAVLYAKTGAFVTAAEEFRSAYERNGNPESLKQYLYALKYAKQEDLFDKEISRLSENRQLLEEIESELYHVSDNEDNTYDYHELMRIRNLKESGRVSDYYKAIDELVGRLKNKYRAENG